MRRDLEAKRGLPPLLQVTRLKQGRSLAPKG